ncbi:MAG: tyrosine-type recombinase/integrase [Planctomycetota bacterium]
MLIAMKGFGRWLVLNRLVASDPLAGVSSLNTEQDRRLQRRALKPDEAVRLIRAAENDRPAKRGISGKERAMAYRIALGTGFRASELRSLHPDSFSLDSAPPHITVEAAYSKRGRDDIQPIRDDLAKRLRPWLATKLVGKRVLALPHDTARMMRRDLRAAEIPIQDDQGRVVDFHALRHTYITRLVASGASVKVAQELARHSTPVLTIGRYAHTHRQEMVEALGAVPPDEATDHQPKSQNEDADHEPDIGADESRESLPPPPYTPPYEARNLAKGGKTTR